MPKKQMTTKVPVPKKPVAKKTIATKSTTRKTTTKPKTPSLVNAVPLSTVTPKKPKQPEQLLYELEMPSEPAKTDLASVEASVVKRGRGRPRKTEVGVVQPLVEKSSESVSQPTAPQSASVSADVPKSEVAPAVSSTRKSKRHFVLHLNRRLLVVLTALVVMVAGGWYWHKTHAQDVASANAQLIAEIGKHVVLPTGETPTISTVVDETKVNQEFLKNAKKGDKVLLYFQSSQAIVYRPSTGQVVNMGPLQTPQPRVFIRQGSTADNVSVVKDIVSRTNEFLVASTDQSAKLDYTKTIVVDLTGNRPDLAGHLAQLLHVNVGNLPAGEDPPDADLLVIVGSDYK